MSVDMDSIERAVQPDEDFDRAYLSHETEDAGNVVKVDAREALVDDENLGIVSRPTHRREPNPGKTPAPDDKGLGCLESLTPLGFPGVGIANLTDRGLAR